MVDRPVQHQEVESCALPNRYSNQPFFEILEKCLWSGVGNDVVPDASRSYRSQHARDL
jgi:hypothetical protein